MRVLVQRAYHLLFLVTGEGGWRLRPHERAMIEAVAAHLGGAADIAIRAQLAEDVFVERTNPRVNVLRFYALPEALRLDGEAFEDALFKVRIEADGTVETGRVTVYQGRVFSVETRRPGKAFRGAGAKVLSVTHGRPSDTLTGALDRLEHGRQGHAAAQRD